MRTCGVVCAAIAGSLACTISGCASQAEPTVRDVVAQFHAAVDARDGATACSLLAPQTTHELEQSAKSPCPSALLDETIPSDGEISKVTTFGGQAQVRVGADTMFLAEFAAGWRVVAAGCTARAALPYDCQVKGG